MSTYIDIAVVYHMYYLIDFPPVDWSLPDAMSEHTNFDEWQCHPFGEEDFPYRGGYI